MSLGLSYTKALNDGGIGKQPAGCPTSDNGPTAVGVSGTNKKQSNNTTPNTFFSQLNEEANKALRAQESAYRSVGTANSITCVYIYIHIYIYIFIDSFFYSLFLSWLHTFCLSKPQACHTSHCDLSNERPYLFIVNYLLIVNTSRHKCRGDASHCTPNATKWSPSVVKKNETAGQGPRHAA